ncbi:MAG: lipocalin-like domain-containing protein [Dehalococcoidales bacterium]|nr:lipocalin-like domain-containing protein [Dehalococcoidales bacterium]
MANSRALRLISLLVILLLISTSAGLTGCNCENSNSGGVKINIIEALSNSDTEGYSIADKVIDFSFPQDHGTHEGFRNEWWYFTGNLYDAEGNRFGYQLTFFRISLIPLETDRTSAWGTNQIYMAHFTVSDVNNGEFYCFEKFNRDALGLAGFAKNPFKMNVGDWYMLGTGEGDFPWQLYASKDGITLSLDVTPLKDIVFEGDNGLSYKSVEKTSASYYYSITRLATEGYIEIDGIKHEVSGNSWLDREWSTSTLNEEQGGWDWFSMQLNDNTEIVYFQLRYKNGSVYPYNEGLIVNDDNSTVKLGTGDIVLTVLETWKSKTGVVYPLKWRAEVVPLGKTLIIEAAFNGQELDLSTRYWEGAVNIYDAQDANTIIGTGYLEMTGYE